MTDAKFKDLTGSRFGSWLVVERGANASQGQAQWFCRCDCGRGAVIFGANLRKGKTRSCGCKRADHIKTHGLSRVPAYKVWHSMRDRCNNQAHRQYKNYGARGIKVCKRWEDFTMFFADMGNPPDKRFIDRIDNNGDYEPSNCRWATALEQQNNKRNNWLLTINGKTMTVAQWARELGIKPKPVYKRLKAGWTPELALGLVTL